MGWRSDTKTLGAWAEYINNLQKKQRRPMDHVECLLTMRRFRSKHWYIMEHHDPKGVLTMREILFGRLIPKFKYDEDGELRLCLDKPKSKFRGILQDIEKYNKTPEKLASMLQEEGLSLIRFIELLECIRFRQEYRKMKKGIDEYYLNMIRDKITSSIDFHLKGGETNFTVNNEVIRCKIGENSVLLAPVTKFHKSAEKAVRGWLKENLKGKRITSHIDILTAPEGNELSVCIRPKDKTGKRLVNKIRLGV